MANHDYTMVVQPLTEEDGGGFLAFAPDLPGCMGDGATHQEAVTDLLRAIDEWIDETERLGKTVPAPGAYAIRAEQERAHINSLLQAQEKLIKEQDRRLSELRDEIGKLQEGISGFVVHGEKHEHAYWLAGGAGVQTFALRGRHRRQPVSH